MKTGGSEELGGIERRVEVELDGGRESFKGRLREAVVEIRLLIVLKNSVVEGEVFYIKIIRTDNVC